MEESTSRKLLWNEAAKAGLVLGLVSILYLVIIQFTPHLGKVMAGASNAILWLAKFIGCIALMNYFIKKYSRSNTRSARELFAFGVATAFLSALIYSAAYMGYTIMFPEKINEAFDAAMSSYSNMLDSSSLEAMENMRSSIGSISFFSSLIWCTLYGTILSAILSNRIARSGDPFNTNTEE